MQEAEAKDACETGARATAGKEGTGSPLAGPPQDDSCRRLLPPVSQGYAPDRLILESDKLFGKFCPLLELGFSPS